ncbi:MAG: class I SAM-dependent methyltransferase [Phycisphaerae bacterium]|nr:class I SAM-dependent methyltransferase [Phycisphaerae bacterium]
MFMFKTGRTNESARHAWVRRELTAIPAGTRLLDAGCGKQPYRDACAHLTYVAQDFGDYDPSSGAGGLHPDAFPYGRLDHRCDIAAIPEPDGAFGAILCTEVIEHVTDPIAALRELARLLRPGGILLVTAPFVSLTHFAPFHFCTGFNRYFYETHLKQFDCASIECVPNGNYFELVAQELWRLPRAAQRYGGVLAAIATAPALAVGVPLCAVASALDRDGWNGSAELGCYGLHVRAVKSS